MEIIAHRGFWIEESEKNSSQAFVRALENGFGIETDIRDFDGTLVISHDMAKSYCLSVEEFFCLVEKIDPKVTLALNIKADGLHAPLNGLLNAHAVNGFVFDMSIPDTLGYFRLGINTYTRQSEYEPVPAFTDRADGIWLDCFESDWFDSATVMQHINAGKRVCVVSPELHKRNYLAVWKMLGALEEDPATHGKISLCTDFPEDARQFFKDFQ